MCITEFRKYLKNQGLTSNGIASRVAKINKIELILDNTMDNIVSNDTLMYKALVSLQMHEDPKHNPMQNVLRKYYSFNNGKDFPKKNEFERFMGM